MPFAAAVPWIVMGISALAGALKNRNKAKETTSAAIDPAFGPLQNVLVNNAMKRLNQPSGLPAGFEASGITGINKTFDVGQQSLESILTSRGLSNSPMAVPALSRMEGNRLGEIARFRTGLPLMEKEMQDQEFMRALQVLGMGRFGATTTTETSGGGGVSGGLNNMAAILGFLYGSGAFGGGANAGSNINM